ncbi:MAG TPA: hypothetical protein VNZ45_04710 [Bacteroidia bacterium]|nr:hypothetical protein [Bacteroidia bacterium]
MKKTSTNFVLIFIGLVFLTLAFASCSSESTIPTARHMEPIHGETRWQ